MNNQFYGNPSYFQHNQNFSEQFKVISVNNFDEVKNFNIDYFNTYVFIDQLNSNIFLKKINNNGFQEILTFRRVENPPDQNQLFNERITNIERLLNDLMSKKWGEFNESANKSNDVPTNVKQFTTTESGVISEGAGDVTGKKRTRN